MTATIRRLLLAALTATAITVPAAACGSHPAQAAVYEPAAWGPTYAGQVYCGYEYTPLECVGHPGVPMQFPTAQPVAGTLAGALWTHLLTYPSYYHSPYYYDHYLAPRHVTVVNRTTFISAGKTFDSRYKTAEAKYDAKAKYRGPGGKTYTGNKYGSLSTSVTKRKTSTGGGGNAGSKTDPGKKASGKTGSKTTTKTGGGVTRKTGTGTSGGRYSGGSRSGGYSGSRSGGGYGGRR